MTCVRGGSAGARSESRVRGTGTVYGASNAPCESVAGGCDGARSLRRRRYALIGVHPCCIDTRRWCQESRFFVSRVIEPPKVPYKSVSRSYHNMPTTATHDKPSTVSDSVRHGDKCMALHGVKTARNRGSFDDAMLIR